MRALLVFAWVFFVLAIRRSPLFAAYTGIARNGREAIVSVIVGLCLALIGYFVRPAEAITILQVREAVRDVISSTNSGQQNSKPMLRGTIHQVTEINSRDLGNRFLVRMSVSNDGEDSAATGFILHVTDKGGKELLHESPMEIADFRLTVDVAGQPQQLVLQKSDNLAFKSHISVKKGTPLDGFLLYAPKLAHVPDKESEHFQDAGVSWVINFFDYKSTMYAASTQFKEGDNKQIAPFTVPAD